jgi:hypothetical protein
MSATIELTFDQLVSAIKQLNPAELETLAILFEPGLAQELRSRWKQAEQEASAGQLLSVEELFAGLD